MTAVAIVGFFVFVMSPALWWVGRRAWSQMGGHSPTPYDRSQAQNRRAAVRYREARPQVQQARFARRRTMNFDK